MPKVYLNVMPQEEYKGLLLSTLGPRVTARIGKG